MMLRPAMRHPLVVTIVVLGAGCGSQPSTPRSAPSLQPLAGEARDGSFTLTVRAEEAEVGVADEIHVSATLGHDEDGEVLLTGSGSGLVQFSVTRLDDGLTSGPPVHTDDCVRYVIPPDEPLTVPFSKSSGYAPEDPNADFLEIYVADPELRLPAGRWRIEAIASAFIGPDCGGEQLGMTAAVEVTVTD